MGGPCSTKAMEGDIYCKRHRKEAGPQQLELPRHHPAVGEARQEKGIALVTVHNDTWVKMAKPILWQIAREKGKVGSDDLRYYIRDHNLSWPESENAFGAAMKGSGLMRTNESFKSTWPSRNGGRSFYWVIP